MLDLIHEFDYIRCRLANTKKIACIFQNNPNLQ
jgi:hypothetical protein